MMCAGPSSSSSGEAAAEVLALLKRALGAAEKSQKPGDTEAARRQSIAGHWSSIGPSGGKRAARMIVAVLDEMDQLISQDQSVLYELFTLAQVTICATLFTNSPQ